MLYQTELVRFMEMRHHHSKLKILREFRQWVREQQAQGWPTAPGKSSPTKQRKRKNQR
jgi:hypothetical protein